MTKGELRKQLEIELSKQYGLSATKQDIIKIRLNAARLAG